MRIPVVFLLLSLCVISCDEAANVWLPEKTAEGMNTLGFVTDDHIWMNYGVRCTDAGCKENLVSAVLYKQGEQPFELQVKGGFTVHRRGIDQTFTLVAHGITGVGVYRLDFANNDQVRYAAYDSAGCHEFVNGTDAELIITTYDTSRHIIAGEFRARLINPMTPSREVNIREGRFDAELVYQDVK
jgi:hypothetical protein